MNPKATLNYKNGCVYVAGDLTFSSVMGLWRQSLIFMKKTNHLQFDFSEVSQANSAAIALLLEWLRYAKEHGKTLSFLQLPEQLKSMIRISGTGPLFTLTGVTL